MFLAFSLSGKVLKWRKSRTVEVWRKPVFTSYIREYVRYLKKSLLKCPAIISQHFGSLLALVPLFTWCKFPGEITLRAYRSPHGDILGRSLSDKCTFKDIPHPCRFVGLHKISHLITIVFCLMIPKQHIFIIFFNNFRAAFSTSLS